MSTAEKGGGGGGLFSGGYGNYVHGYDNRHKATPALNEAPLDVCRSQPSVDRYVNMYSHIGNHLAKLIS